MSDELDLNALGDDDLVQQMHDDLYDGLKQEIEQGVRILLDRGWTPYDVLTKALVEGMRIVGEDFRDGILFVPEVLMSANAMKAGMSILRPLIRTTGQAYVTEKKLTMRNCAAELSAAAAPAPAAKK